MHHLASRAIAYRGRAAVGEHDLAGSVLRPRESHEARACPSFRSLCS
jgi:hypothetical protein